LISNLLAPACSRGTYVPSADVDEIVAVFYSFQGSASDTLCPAQGFACETGKIVVNSRHTHPARLRDISATFVDRELDLINCIVDVILDLDPDIILGWEIQSTSWGYLNIRCACYGLPLSHFCSQLH
jgi:DNA polymerase zeta